jgi:hypothetical protein
MAIERGSRPVVVAKSRWDGVSLEESGIRTRDESVFKRDSGVTTSEGTGVFARGTSDGMIGGAVIEGADALAMEVHEAGGCFDRK